MVQDTVSKNLEMMKKILEEKKSKGKNTKNTSKANKVVGAGSSKGVRVGNGGGLFDR
ncbi:hypothetical protein [Clostridium sp.]|uniref:hypothetical protein n=1 Tax=Clostridium sp. TaxID=1506 RepID=UPI003F674755